MRIHMMTLISMISLVLLTGCETVSPYQQQADQLQQAYNAGLISANDYYTRLNELQALDLQRRQAMASAFMQANYQNQQWQMQQQQLQQQRNQQQQQMMWQNINNTRSRSGSGTVNGPNGTYFYNWNEQ